MDNHDTRVTHRYHRETKHSVLSVQTNRHYLDWANQPTVYKDYRDVELLSLLEDLMQTGKPALEVLLEMERDGTGEAIPDLSRLAYILYYSGGITKKLLYPGGEIEFRAAAAAGALYPIEIYVVSGDLPGVPAGVYHYGPGDFSLRILRTGDYRAYLADVAGREGNVSAAPFILVLSAITWRSAWKYQARSYRYHFWDGGTVLANCLAACQALGLPAEIVMGFADREVDRLLGIDGEFEKSLALVPVGKTAGEHGFSPEVPLLDLEVEPLSAEWRTYPIIDELHRASSLEDRQAVEEWRRDSRAGRGQSKVEQELLIKRGKRFALPTFDPVQKQGKSLEETIVKRGSSRRFRRQPLPGDEFSAILNAATVGFRRDWAEPGSPLLNHMFVNIHAIEGFPPGAYLYLPGTQELALLREGDFRGHSAYLCLGQDLGGDSSATVYFLADLEAVLNRYGNRGYRAVQLEAGLLGGKMYLGAYALDRGASGLTFFDDDVVNFFSPVATGMEAIFVTALGVPDPPVRRTGTMTYLRPGEANSD